MWFPSYRTLTTEGKMSTIKQATHLSLCEECGCHGHIVCADGKESEEFGTKVGGLKELTALSLSGSVEKDEMLKVRRQIEGSDLKPRDREVEDLFRRFSRAKEKLREWLDEFHQEIESYWVDEERRRENRPEKTLH